MTRAAKSQTGMAYSAIKTAILDGTFQPGERLSAPELSQRLDFGPTPIREALAKLSSEGHVVAFEQRGFRVPHLTATELKELLDLRLSFESDALARSMRQGGEAWETGILTAFHRLKSTAAPVARAEADPLLEWNARHDAFHAALIAGCERPWLMRFHTMAGEQIMRYRIAIQKRFGTLHPDSTSAIRLKRLLSHEEHGALKDSVLARSAEALDRLEMHISETAAIYAELFSAP